MIQVRRIAEVLEISANSSPLIMFTPENNNIVIHAQRELFSSFSSILKNHRRKSKERLIIKAERCTKLNARIIFWFRPVGD
jgi:hypothetical protein